ncbi:MAG: hypothetical protein U0X91_05875 [Spirosomataceae bacterium]
MDQDKSPSVGTIKKEDSSPKPPYNDWAWIWGTSAILITGFLYYSFVFQGIDAANWQQRLWGLLLLSGYLFASFWLTAIPNYDNIGLFRGLINHPFRISDDYNRFLIFLQLLLLPGKLLSQGILIFWKLLQPKPY